jgi:hypothetical protein
MSKEFVVDFNPVDLQKIREVPLNVGKEAFRLLAQEIHAGFKAESPVDDGKLQKWQRKKINAWEYHIHGAAHYALYVALGTGIYGPKKKRIYPKKAQALRFMIGNKVIFAKSIAGQKPNPYHERATQNGVERLDEFIRIAQRKFNNND